MIIRRVVQAAGAAALAMTLACGSDQPATSPIPARTAAELALHFDTLAAQLQASSPSDIRLTWYQNIASIVGLGVSPSTSNLHVGGELTVLATASETDAFPDSVNGKLYADSTYRLAGWTPTLKPTEFVDVRVRFLPAGTGHPDTTATFITVYVDTAGNHAVDSTAKATVEVVSNRGTCQVTALPHLSLPPNPCTKVVVNWAIVGGTDLVFISPAAQVSGTHLTQ